MGLTDLNRTEEGVWNKGDKRCREEKKNKKTTKEEDKYTSSK
jgi:hypothetical protein